MNDMQELVYETIIHWEEGGGKRSRRELARRIVDLYAEQAEKQEPTTVEDNSQNWKGMDGATAWLLINRHADGWPDIRKMMEEWLEANQTVQEKQEPVAWVDRDGDVYTYKPNPVWCPPYTPLYTAPPQREWAGLTDGEIDALHGQLKVQLLGTFSIKDIYRAVEAALQEKNA